MRKAHITSKGTLYIAGSLLETQFQLHSTGNWLAIADGFLDLHGWERTGDWVHDHPGAGCQGWTACIERKKMTEFKNGQEVQVTFRGVITCPNVNSNYVRVGRGSHSGLAEGTETVVYFENVTPLEPVIADSDTFTYAELADVLSATNVPRVSYDIVQAIVARREPDYPEGTVVRDANGVYWKRADSKRWKSFDPFHVHENHVPVRPLKTMP